jgi:hypothetical protein
VTGAIDEELAYRADRLRLAMRGYAVLAPEYELKKGEQPE